MIRIFQPDDLERVMELWLSANGQAHDFIPRSHWEEYFDAVEALIPQASVFVWETDGRILGFLGLNGRTVEGLFVDASARSRGIGKALLDHAKQECGALTLRAYQKNEGAVRFYRREVFLIQGRRTDRETGETELILCWEQRRNAVP